MQGMGIPQTRVGQSYINVYLRSCNKCHCDTTN